MTTAAKLIGMTFGRLKVLSLTGKKNSDNRPLLECVCECGKIALVPANRLRTGITSSCGCLRTEIRKKRLTTHGLGKTNVGNAWLSMIRRSEKFQSYISRGIKVCSGIRNSPQKIMDLIGDRPSKKHSVDRFPDNQGHYSCGSCEECVGNGWSKNIRWATQKEQCRNTERNIEISAFGKTMLLCDWAEVSGLDQTVIMRRIRRGDMPEKALSTPNKKGECYRHWQESGE